MVEYCNAQDGATFHCILQQSTVECEALPTCGVVLILVACLMTDVTMRTAIWRLVSKSRCAMSTA